MKSEWKTCKAEDFIEFNPRLTIRKGETATKVSMDKLQPFTKAIPEVEQAVFSGGSKFCNGDTIMARITPCLENGKTAFVDKLQDGEVAFGSTEFIVMRARPGISDPQFVYYLAISPFFRDVAIKSMVGSSGRQVAFGSTEYIVLSPKEGTPPEFLYCLARYPAFVDYAVKNMNGSSGRQRVSADTVGQYRLPKLSRQDFEGFGNAVAPLFLKMRYNSLENMRLSALRDTLIPKLMSGEIDVSNV